MNWILKSFSELTSTELYQIIQLRIDIFIVEQNCPYRELDGKDQDEGALHLFSTEGDRITSYLRILPPGCSYKDMSSLGRVVTHSSCRGTGLGHKLIERANQIIDERWPNFTCHLSAQAHLSKYYQKHGYHTVGEGYLEDEIPHIGMER
ncbi:MAG: GNAT family N-acetyltransferase [Kangiellaceae bacterium]|nr:GNAT family N-acetyltransferase [Kangiellaceae bacterium]